MANPVIEYEWDSRDLVMWRGGKVEGALQRALRLAGNQAIRTLQKASWAVARRRKALPDAVIKEDQRLKLPGRSVAIRALAWALFVIGRPVPVFKFPHLDTRGRRSNNGVLVRFGAGGTQRLGGAFIARMKSGHAGVFRRVGGAKRLPIDELFSARLPKDYGNDVMVQAGDKTYRKLAQAFVNGVERELKKLRHKGLA